MTEDPRFTVQAQASINEPARSSHHWDPGPSDTVVSLAGWENELGLVLRSKDPYRGADPNPYQQIAEQPSRRLCSESQDSGQDTGKGAGIRQVHIGHCGIPRK